MQNAIDAAVGQHKLVYFPAGTYVITKSLRWRNKAPKGSFVYGFTWLQGQNARRTILRLKDSTFTDAAKPQPMMWCGGFGSADWFHNYVQDLTFDIGRDNPGATGLQFYSNNTGAVRNVAIVSGDGQGTVGLDLAHRDMNGPFLTRNVVIQGFDYGVRTGWSVNSFTFEHLRLVGQNTLGFWNGGQSVAIRRLVSENRATALKTESFLALLDAELRGTKGAAGRPALIAATSAFFGRDIATSGYRCAIADASGQPLHADAKVAEFHTGKATSPFGGASRSLRLPIRETPDVPWDDPTTWAVVDDFGADPTGRRDSAAAIQKAIDSGRTTVFFPGFYQIESPVKVRGKVRRLLGTGAWVDYLGKSKPDFIIEDGDAPVVVVEHFAPINGGIEVDTARTTVFRSLESRRIRFRREGDAFFEDVATDDLRLNPKQKSWARQLNIENEGTHFTNDGGNAWILGYKTERGGTLIHTKNGGRTELFGTFSYTTTAGKLAPMFDTDDASVFAMFNEVCFTGDPFAILIRERRGGEVRTVPRGKGGISPYVGVAPGLVDR